MAAQTAQTAADSEAIRQAAPDYIEGYYESDAAWTQRASTRSSRSGSCARIPRARPWLSSMGASQLIAGTRAGSGREIPAAERKTDVTIPDVFHDAASARIDAGPWIDYLHLARRGAVGHRQRPVGPDPRRGSVNPRGLLLAAAVPVAIVVLFTPPALPPGPAPLGRTIPGEAKTAPTQSPAYARLVARHVREGTIEGVRLRVVDYEAISRDLDFRQALAEIAEAQPEEMSRDDQMAFWINAYNVLAIRLVVDGYPIESIRDLDSEHEDVRMAAGTAGGGP